MRILVEDKWDTWICEGEKAALDLVTQRLEQVFWYENWDEGDPKTQYKDRAEKLLKLKMKIKHGSFFKNAMNSNMNK